jgi:hypothetical protein
MEKITKPKKKGVKIAESEQQARHKSNSIYRIRVSLNGETTRTTISLQTAKKWYGGLVKQIDKEVDECVRKGIELKRYYVFLDYKKFEQGTKWASYFEYTINPDKTNGGEER